MRLLVHVAVDSLALTPLGKLPFELAGVEFIYIAGRSRFRTNESDMSLLNERYKQLCFG